MFMFFLHLKTNKNIKEKKKIEIISGHAYMDQEKLFDEKNRKRKIS
jgi:hypothetical protein